jgi:hypothetical protein
MNDGKRYGMKGAICPIDNCQVGKGTLSPLI